MRINLSDKFKKYYQKRVPQSSSLENRYTERVKIFLVDKRSPVMKDHALTGKLSSFRAFWITGDIRVVYFVESDDLVTFVNIGSHNQVYS